METIQIRLNKNFVIGLLSLIVGLLLAYIVFSALAGSSRTPVVTDQVNNQQQQQAEQDVTITPSPTNTDENIFASKSLGLRFNYLKYGYSFDEDNHGIIRSVLVDTPTVAGNTISFSSNYGGSMTKYDKQPTQSLEAAISAQFLQGIPTTKCLPVRVTTDSENAFYTPTSSISYVILKSVVPGGCPSQFNFSNPTSAFVSFSSNPNAFFYVVGTADEMIPLLTSNGDPFWVTMKFN